MLADALLAVAVAGPVAAAGVAVGLAVWALSGLRRPDVRARVRPVGLFVPAVAAFLLIGGVIELLGGWFLAYGIFTDAERPELGEVMANIAPAAAAIGLGAALSSIVGYLAFARLGPPRRAANGSTVGPLVAVALAIAGGTILAFGSSASSAAANGAEQDALTNRSGSIHVTVSDVHPTAGVGGAAVTALRMRVVIRSDADLELGSRLKVANPRFVLSSPNGHGFEPATSAATGALPRGVSVPFDLAFDTTTAAGHSGVRLASTFDGPPGPGAWTLRIDIEDSAGRLYTVTTDVTVALSLAPSA